MRCVAFKIVRTHSKAGRILQRWLFCLRGPPPTEALISLDVRKRVSVMVAIAFLWLRLLHRWGGSAAFKLNFFCNRSEHLRSLCVPTCLALRCYLEQFGNSQRR